MWYRQDGTRETPRRRASCNKTRSHCPDPGRVLSLIHRWPQHKIHRNHLSEITIRSAHCPLQFERLDLVSLHRSPARQLTRIVSILRRRGNRKSKDLPVSACHSTPFVEWKVIIQLGKLNMLLYYAVVGRLSLSSRGSICHRAIIALITKRRLVLNFLRPSLDKFSSIIEQYLREIRWRKINCSKYILCIFRLFSSDVFADSHQTKFEMRPFVFVISSMGGNKNNPRVWYRSRIFFSMTHRQNRPYRSSQLRKVHFSPSWAQPIISDLKIHSKFQIEYWKYYLSNLLPDVENLQGLLLFHSRMLYFDDIPLKLQSNFSSSCRNLTIDSE